MKVGWLRPPVSWYKLNSDGSSLGNPGLAGGGLIQNDTGDWVKGGLIRDDTGDWV